MRNERKDPGPGGGSSGFPLNHKRRRDCVHTVQKWKGPLPDLFVLGAIGNQQKANPTNAKQRGSVSMAECSRVVYCMKLAGQ